MSDVDLEADTQFHFLWYSLDDCKQQLNTSNVKKNTRHVNVYVVSLVKQKSKSLLFWPPAQSRLSEML